MNIQAPILIMSFLLLTSVVGHTGNTSSRNINRAATVADYMTKDAIHVSYLEANNLNSDNVQNCTAHNSAICQSFSGGAGLQSSVRDQSLRNQKVVTVVRSRGYVKSYAKQQTKLDNEKAQNCAAIACVQILEE